MAPRDSDVIPSIPTNNHFSRVAGKHFHDNAGPASNVERARGFRESGRLSDTLENGCVVEHRGMRHGVGLTAEFGADYAVVSS